MVNPHGFFFLQAHILSVEFGVQRGAYGGGGRLTGRAGNCCNTGLINK